MKLIMRYFSILTFLILSMHLSAQDEVTLNGYINDASNGESLIGATSYITQLGIGASSNEYGFYSITIAPGDYTVEFAYLGYQSSIVNINISEDLRYDIELSEEALQLEEIVITAEPEDRNVTDVEMSTNKCDHCYCSFSLPNECWSEDEDCNIFA